MEKLIQERNVMLHHRVVIKQHAVLNLPILCVESHQEYVIWMIIALEKAWNVSVSTNIKERGRERRERSSNRGRERGITVLFNILFDLLHTYCDQLDSFATDLQTNALSLRYVLFFFFKKKKCFDSLW